MRNSAVHDVPRLPAPLAGLIFVGAVAALAGGYWDDAWHTERGRDEFFIAPHLAIYGGVALAGGALALWSMLAARAAGLAALRSHGPLALALLAVAVTLASGPIDNAWHAAFGRDSVIWSPPHMLGIAGTFALGAAVLAELADRDLPWARGMRIATSGLLVAAAAFVTVEYDTDVPQFDALWYLPVLGVAAAIALSVVRLGSPSALAATTAAALHLGFVVVVGGLLLALAFPPPALPLLIAPALALDLAARRGLGPLAAGFGYALALFGAYVPVRNLLGDGVRIDLADALIGLPLTWLGAAAVLALAAGRPLPGRRSAVVAALVVALLAPPAAWGHDPGQGDDAGTLALSLRASERTIALQAVLPERACRRTRARRMVARRAGRELAAPLRRRGCRLSGSLPVPERGRWFVYVELVRGGRLVESWLPVDAGGGQQRAGDSRRYAYFPPERSSSVVKVAAGVVLYAALLALLVATLSLVRGAAAAARTPHARSDPRHRSA